MNVTPEQLAGTRPAALRAAFAALPATIATPIAGLSEVAGHYLAAVYFTDSGPDDGQWSPDDVLAPETTFKALADCAAFLAEVQHLGLLTPYGNAGGTLAQMGHDFWLTRNGHGAGFWDRGNLQVRIAMHPPGMPRVRDAALGDALSEAARAAGVCDTYQGDDGLIYFG
jgi:hypothetical protein